MVDWVLIVNGLKIEYGEERVIFYAKFRLPLFLAASFLFRFHYLPGPFGLLLYFMYMGHYQNPVTILRNCTFSTIVDNGGDITGCPFNVAMEVKSKASVFVDLSMKTFSSNVKVRVQAISVS